MKNNDNQLTVPAKEEMQESFQENGQSAYQDGAYFEDDAYFEGDYYEENNHRHHGGFWKNARMQALLQKLKGVPGKLLEFNKTQNAQLKVELNDLICRRYAVRNGSFLKNFFISLAIVAVFSLLCGSVAVKNSADDPYMSTFFVSLGICGVFLFTTLYLNPVEKAPLIYTMFTSMLIIIGIHLQVVYYFQFRENIQNIMRNNLHDPTIVFGVEEAKNAVSDSIGILCLAFVGAVIVAFFVVHIMQAKDKKTFIALLSVAFAILCIIILILRATHQSVNGAYNWVRIGGVSIQVSELLKFVVIMLFAILYSEQGVSDKNRIIKCTLIFAVSAAVLVFIAGEFGTVLILLLAYLAVTYLSVSSKSKFYGLVAVLLIVAFCGIGVANICYNAVNPSEKAASETQVQETTASAEAVTTTEATEGTTKSADSEDKETPIEFVARQYGKVLERLGFKGTQPHAEEISEALHSVKWFGSESRDMLYVAEMNEDIIFSFALMQFGVVFVLFMLLLYAGMRIIVLTKASRLQDTAMSLLIVGFSICISTQSCIQLGVALSVFPIVGMTSAFLSNGGSASLINYAMTFVILYAMRVQVPEKLKARN